MTVPLRPSPGASLVDLERALSVDEKTLPGFLPSVLPVLVPIGLISAASIMAALPEKACPAGVRSCVEFIGNRNVALLCGAAIAMWVLARQKGYTVAKICALVAPPLETAGTIILITSAGGAFGMMLKNAGVGEAIQAAAAGHEVSLVLLAWLVSSVLRIAQGSATVAMLTTSAMMVPIIFPQDAGGTSSLPYHRIYIFLAIGFGSIICSWMNDSGFWVVSKLGGLTEKETFQTWTVVTTVVAVSGLAVTLAGAALFPCAGR